MTSYEKAEIRPNNGRFFGFHHCEFWVGNAKQAAAYFCNVLGFRKIAYRGLETGSRDLCTHVVKQGKIIFSFTSTYSSSPDDKINEHISKHGDGVRDVAFIVDDVESVYKYAIENGAKEVSACGVIKEADDNGFILRAGIHTFGDTIHSLIQINNYKGVFLPGYKLVDSGECNNSLSELNVGLDYIDHCVGNQCEGEMENVAKWYEKMLQFHRFWSVDDKQVHTEYSALRSIVMTDYDRTVKVPINEPAEGKRKSQIQEYVDYYNGPGIQHIAMNTKDIINAVSSLRKRGQEFLTIPKAYYTNLKKKLEHSSVKINENMDKLEELNILVDFDENGYLLQIFTKNIQDRPTVFLEIIQRNNHEGFGAGNFKSLFESIEIDQAMRGNL